MVTINKTKVDKSVKRYDDNQKQTSNYLDSGEFSVHNNIKAEYDMWSWIYQEIANLRISVNQLSTLVRINNENSPNFLEAYHANIYSLLTPISVVIPINLWNKLDKEWLDIKREINSYLKRKNVVHNKKIPFELIRRLDKMYRAALLIAQKSGLGFKVTTDIDIDKAIENAIIGD